jgi:hypothetical protein
MVRGECVWDVCVYISCTGDEGQLGSSFLWNGGGGWGGQLMFIGPFIILLVE